MEGELAPNNSVPKPEPSPRLTDLPSDLKQPGVTSPIQPAGLSTSPVSNEPPLPPEIPRLRPRINWWAWIIGVFVVALLGVTVYVGLKLIGFNRGEVSFTFEPGGATLVIDQKRTEANVSSIKLKLKAGDHIAQVTKDGYLDWEREFSLEAGEKAEFTVILDPIPNLELVTAVAVKSPTLIRKDELLAWFDEPTQQFKAVDIPTRAVINLFEEKFGGLQKFVWSPSGVAVMAKLQQIWELPNMSDNRAAKGQYIPLGGTPEQGPRLSNGIATWLLDSERRNAKGLQPILLNENICDVTFSPDGNSILYFYTAGDGEKSLIQANNIDGSAWVRLATNVSLSNPRLEWLENERYVLVLDDVNQPSQVFDMHSKDLTVIMPDRVAGTPVLGSPDGSRALYQASTTNGQRLAVWNLENFESQTAEKVFEKSVQSFTWEDNNTVIVSTGDGNLWYWDVSGKERPLKFVSVFGMINAVELLYSRLTQQLFILDGIQVFSVKA